ncbi:ImcF-related family protein, partial [Pandoraea terrae]
MNIEPNNTRAEVVAPPPDGKPIAVWGLALLAMIVAAFALAVVWIKGDVVNAPNVEAQKTASLWILSGVIGLLFLHAAASRAGAYRAMGSVFRLQDRSRSAGANTAKVPKHDMRLTVLRDELRLQHGYCWRYRLPWLLVTGDDALTEAVAPGLRQTGFALTEHAVLLHAAPQDIDAGTWRSQIRRLRRRRPVDTVIQVMRADRPSPTDGELPRTLAAIATDLGWAAPVTLLHPVPTTGRQPEAFQAIGAFISGSGRRPAQDCADALARQLTTLELHAGTRGVWLCGETNRMPYLAQVSAYIGEQRERIVKGWEALTASKWLRAPLEGVMFAPVFAGPAALGGVAELEPNADSYEGLPLRQPPSMQPTWQHIGGIAHRLRGKRIGFHWPNALATLITVAAIAWCVALIVSFAGNRQLVSHARTIAGVALKAAPGSANALRAQLALQQTIVMLQYRQAHGAPWHLRAGLSRLDDVLAALWQPYRIVSERNLQRPAARMLGLVLTDLGELPDDSVHDGDTLQRGYDALKAYLMLAEPARTEPAFLAQQLLAAWSAPAGMPPGEWADTASRLTAFYAQQLEAHPEWRIDAEAPAAQGMLAGARATLVNQIGLSNRDDM